MLGAEAFTVEELAIELAWIEEYIGGGIAPRMIGHLSSGALLRAFTAHGRMAELLSSIPVQIITAQAALLGAAQYGLDQMAKAEQA